MIISNKNHSYIYKSREKNNLLKLYIEIKNRGNQISVVKLFDKLK